MRTSAGTAGDETASDDSFRRLLGFGLMRASSALRPVTRSGDPIWARAHLESAAITERYYYRQQISLNSSLSVERDPGGEVEFVLPLDGEKYFTRQAYGDAMRAYDRGASRDADAVVGFLGLTGYEKTDLAGVLGVEEHHAFPVQAQLPQAADHDQVDPLLADRSACVISHAYRPTAPFSVDVSIDINDPDTSDLPRPAEVRNGEGIMRQIEFRPGLSLTMTVQLFGPRGLADDADVRVTGVFVAWPTRTSLQSLRLRVAGKPHSLSYNPERAGGGGLEWRDVRMTNAQGPYGDERRVFRSEPMILAIPKPGDLYHQDELRGEVEVTVNRLLSGTSARLFDSRGRACRHPELETKSVVTTQFSVLLEDAFARRMLSPSQQMTFDEVIPDERRLDDIRTVLRNRGFEVREVAPSSGPTQHARPSIDPRSWCLLANRPHGPYEMDILLYVEGRRYPTTRKRQAGGEQYETEMDSGKLEIYAYGWLPRDSEPVVREMNGLRQDLHERFERLSARR